MGSDVYIMEKLSEQLRKEARGVVNTTAHYMKLAENYMTEDNVDAARACLLLLCESCDNYEDSIEWNGLTEQLQRYRYLVSDYLPPSPAQRTMQIADILALPDEEILSALSDHLDELIGNGDAHGALNKWERTAYYIDELCIEVNSGGFDSYLYYHGTHFEKAYTALKDIAALKTLLILDNVRDKFPKCRVPVKENALQKAMDSLAEKGVDFDREDERFYTVGEKELLNCLLSYVKDNKQHFR